MVLRGCLDSVRRLSSRHRQSLRLWGFCTVLLKQLETHLNTTSMHLAGDIRQLLYMIFLSIFLTAPAWRQSDQATKSRLESGCHAMLLKFFNLSILAVSYVLECGISLLVMLGCRIQSIGEGEPVSKVSSAHLSSDGETNTHIRLGPLPIPANLKNSTFRFRPHPTLMSHLLLETNIRSSVQGPRNEPTHQSPSLSTPSLNLSHN